MECYYYVFCKDSLLLEQGADGTCNIPCANEPPTDTKPWTTILDVAQLNGHDVKAYSIDLPIQATESLVQETQGKIFLPLRQTYYKLSQEHYLMAGKCAELLYWHNNTRFCGVCGGTMKFQRIPADGSKKMDDTYMESIEPFNYSDLVPFSAAYLTGYLADKYDVDADASAPRADKRVEQSALEVLQSTIKGYDTCSEESHAVIKNNGEVIYAMVPVWILTTRYNDKPYTFMMNGQTGKVVGSLPYDSKKAFLYPAVCSLILMPIIYFIAKFFMF